MAIAFLTLLLDLPVLMLVVTTRLLAGHGSDLNNPYRSWSFVRDGSLSEIFQTTAEEWGCDKWLVFTVKWNEWVYVLHAIVFFSIFGTTLEARRQYRTAVSSVLDVILLRKKRIAPRTSVITFNSNPSQGVVHEVKKHFAGI